MSSLLKSDVEDLTTYLSNAVFRNRPDTYRFNFNGGYYGAVRTTCYNQIEGKNYEQGPIPTGIDLYSFKFRYRGEIVEWTQWQEIKSKTCGGQCRLDLYYGNYNYQEHTIVRFHLSSYGPASATPKSPIYGTVSSPHRDIRNISVRKPSIWVRIVRSIC